jgi:hypothetical protein
MSILSERSPKRNIYIDGSYYYAEDEKGVMQEKSSSFSTVFNAVMNDLSATGGRVNIAPGSYSVDARLDVDVNAVAIQGEGWDTVLTLANNVDDHVFRLSSSNCWLSDLLIDGNNANNSGTIHGIYVYRSAGHRIYRLKIRDCEEDGIHIGESSGTFSTIQCLGGKIYNNYVGDTSQQNTGSGIYLDYAATDWEIHSNVIAQHRQSGVAGLMIDGDNNNFMGNHLWGNYYNYRLAPDHSMSGMHLHGDKCMDNMYHGIYASDNSVRYAVITGCFFWRQGESAANQDSINFTGATTYANTIVGNTFRGEDQTWTRQARYAVNLDASTTYTVFVGNTVGGYTNAAGYSITGANCQDAHNVVYDCGP